MQEGNLGEVANENNHPRVSMEMQNRNIRETRNDSPSYDSPVEIQPEISTW